MERKFYKNLFVVNVEDFFNSQDSEKYFIFQGSKNWDMYLVNKPKSVEYSTLENIELLSFKEKINFLEHMQNIDLIDYSLEHISDKDRYLILANCNEY